MLLVLCVDWHTEMYRSGSLVPLLHSYMKYYQLKSCWRVADNEVSQTSKSIYANILRTVQTFPTKDTYKLTLFGQNPLM